MTPSRQVISHTELRRGDHISFYRCSPVGYYHHSIVLEVEPTHLITISFTNPEQGGYSSPQLSSHPGFYQFSKKSASIQRKRIAKEEFRTETVYVYEYEDSKCFGADEVIDRALSVEKGTEAWGEYSVMENNCEHFASWCKTGKKTSVQAETVAAGGKIVASLALQRMSRMPGWIGWLGLAGSVAYSFVENQNQQQRKN